MSVLLLLFFFRERLKTLAVRYQISRYRGGGALSTSSKHGDGGGGGMQWSKIYGIIYSLVYYLLVQKYTFIEIKLRVVRISCNLQCGPAAPWRTFPADRNTRITPNQGGNIP